MGLLDQYSADQAIDPELLRRALFADPSSVESLDAHCRELFEHLQGVTGGVQ